MKEKQEFTTQDTISVLMLICICTVLVYYICSRYSEQSKGETARRKARTYATELLQYYNRTTELSSARRLAAENSSIFDLKMEGRIGMDPWGKAFRYRLMSDSKGRKAIIVTSSGPDLKPESDYLDLVDSSLTPKVQNSDDIVVHHRL